jgi:hypothetical protein
MEASVSEIHCYPLRPEGFEEPLFPTRESRRVVGDHLLRAPWLSRASEMEGRGGQAAHARREPVEVECSFAGGCARVSRTSGRCRKKRRVVEVLGRWREVRAWWDEERAKDRKLVRVLLSDGAVVDLARENGREWFLVGVPD